MLTLTVFLQPEELLPPTIYDTAIFRLPIWFLNTVKGRLGLSTGSSTAADGLVGSAELDADDAQDIGSDFEFVDKSVDDLGVAKSSGLQAGGGKKRGGNKKR